MTELVLYGVKNAGVEVAAAELGAQLCLTFQDRESDYLGVYMLAEVNSTTVKIVGQPDPAGDSVEDDFPSYKTLIYVENDGDFPALDGIRVVSEGIERLRGDHY